MIERDFEMSSSQFLQRNKFEQPFREAAVRVLTDPGIIEEQYSNILNGTNEADSLAILIDIVQKQEFDVPLNVLEKMVVFLDPDNSSNEELVKNTMDFLSELCSYKTADFKTFFSNPTIVDFAAVYFPSESSTKLIVSILKLNQNVWQRFSENGLISKIIIDLQSQSPNFNCTIPILTKIPSGFDSSQFIEPLINLLQNVDDNVVSDTLSALTNLCKQNLSICCSLLNNANFLQLFGNDNFDDLLVADFIEIAKSIVSTTNSCLIFRIDDVFNFMINAITDLRDVDESIEFICQASDTDDFCELCSNQILYGVLSSVIDSDAKYKVRAKAAIVISKMIVLAAPSFIDAEITIGHYNSLIETEKDDFAALCLAATLTLTRSNPNLVPIISNSESLMNVINRSVDSTNQELAEISTQLLDLIEAE